MRLIAFAISLALMGAAALAGQSLWEVLRAPPQEADAVAVVARADLEGGAAEPMPPRRWPALFGEVVKAEPQPPKPPEPPAPPAPPKPPAPPMESLGYTLQGVVRAGSSEWAIVSHPSGDRILRVGDALDTGITVMGMDEGGLLLDRDGSEARLKFPE